MPCHTRYKRKLNEDNEENVALHTRLADVGVRKGTEPVPKKKQNGRILGDLR